MDNKKLAQFIDHTLLKPDAMSGQIEQLCREANEWQFYAVCINPHFLEMAKRILDENINLCTVVGFPLGANLTEVKVFEAKKAIDKGATEIDMVINISDLKAGEKQKVIDDIAAVVDASQNALTKVIVETCLLTDKEKVLACQCVESAKADYIKTSTGFSHHGAQLEDIKLFKHHLNDRVAIKASGGIKTKADALSMIENGASRLGTSSGVSLVSL